MLHCFTVSASLSNFLLFKLTDLCPEHTSEPLQRDPTLQVLKFRRYPTTRILQAQSFSSSVTLRGRDPPITRYIVEQGTLQTKFGTRKGLRSQTRALESL